MSKPREFHLWNNWFGEEAEFSCMYVFGITIDQMERINEDEKIHVIEKSAYDDVISKLAVAVEALEWMKNPEYFDKSCLPVIDKALTKIKVEQ